MKKINFAAFFILGITSIFLNSCASTDPYKYKDSRIVFKIDVDEPEPQVKNAKQEFYLINRTITVLPFIDNRNFEKSMFATDIPCSILLSKYFYKNLIDNYIFKSTTFAEKNIYNNKKITFDEYNFSYLKTKLKTDAFMWGIIYEFDIVISPDKIQNQYILTLHIRGDVKIMSDSGKITYYHDYNKTRSYTFKSDSFFSYSLYDIKSLGNYINNFFEWIVDGEINRLITFSEEFSKGKLIIENIIPDVLIYPNEQTKLYDAAIITSASFLKTAINYLGMFAGAIGCGFTVYYLSGRESNNPGSILSGILIGMPLGLLTGFFITNYFTDKFYEENEKKAIFYASSNNKNNFILNLYILNLKL